MNWKFSLKLFLCILLLFFLVSCKKDNYNIPNLKQPPLRGGQKDCICIEIYDPVCGEDRQTYSNSCFADCAEVKYTKGVC